MQNNVEFRKEVVRHAQGVLSSTYEMSLFWENILKEFKSKIKADLTWGELEQLIRLLKYRDKPLTKGSFEEEDDFLMALDIITKKGDQLTSLDLKDLGKGMYEHLAHLHFLKAKNLYDDYRQFFRPLKLRSSMFTIRMYHYARLIEKMCQETWQGKKAKFSFFEIGAGSGYLAYFLSRMGLVQEYHIVDLPEMLVNSTTALSSFLPEARFSFYPRSESTTNGSDSVPSFLFTSANDFGSIRNESYDVFLNFNSFMEMDRGARDGYINGIYKLARPGSLFINANRRQTHLPQRDGIKFDNNPLLYPYRSTDQILYWGVDEIQEWTRARLFCTAESFSILRCALIGL